MSAGRNISELLTWALCAVTGSLDRAGGIWFNPSFFQRFDQNAGLAHIGYPCLSGPPSRPDLPAPLGQFPCAALADEIEEGNLRALLVAGGNPVNALPQPDRVRAALGRLDVLATCEVTWSETARVASHVLACTSQMEQPEVLVYDRVYPVIASHSSDRICSPVAQRKPIWWIFAQLGRRLGIQVLSPDLDIDTVTHEEVLASLVSPEKLALVKAAPSVYVEEGPVYGWILDRGPLLDGRWQFDHPEVLEELVRIEPPGPLALVPRRQVRHMNSVFYRPDEPSVIVNPADAASAEVCVGDRVRVSSPYGSVEGKILVTGDIARGSVSIPHGFNDLLVGNLTSDTSDVDRLNGMVTYSGVSLRIELVRRAGSGEA